MGEPKAANPAPHAIGAALADLPEPVRHELARRIASVRIKLARCESEPKPQAGTSQPENSWRTAEPDYRKLLKGSDADVLGGPMLRRSPYGEYVRRCFQLEDKFPLSEVHANFEHSLRWYLEFYGSIRLPLRIPLSAQEIRYLNEPSGIDGEPHPISRAMLWFRPGPDAAVPRDEKSLRELTYWWACERAPALGVEDCLVTDAQIEFLRAVPPGSAGEPFPLSQAMEAELAKRPELGAFGPPRDPSARMALYLAVLLEALDQPGTVRFVPHDVIDQFLRTDAPLFDQLVSELDDMADVSRAHTHTHTPLNASRYRRLLAAAGLDLDGLRFTTVDPHGHRIEAARLTPPLPVRDVQVIGWVSRASGLAQATRASFAALQRTRFECGAFDFVLKDNLQPKEPRLETAAGQLTRARINLVHLNADMLPMAHAYLPDVFTGSYTIGFFFWELNRPAAGHRLALDLVDEIWVASEYNRRCFAGETNKPVINVGLALPEQPEIDRFAARARLRDQFGYPSSAFLFFGAYDSFSFPQRKNPFALVRAFQAAFPDDPDVGLIIKTHNATADPGLYRLRLWHELLGVAVRDPRIRVVNETLDYETLMAWKCGSDCYVSLHRSEGFGIGMLEAMRLGVPVVCTGFSGNMDFCNERTAWLVDYEEVPVMPGEYVSVEPGHVWASPDHDSAVAALRSVRARHEDRARRAQAASALAHTHYGVEATARRYEERLKAIMERGLTDPPRAAGGL